jgi:hypothetical protein
MKVETIGTTTAAMRTMLLCGALLALSACAGPVYTTGANVDTEYDFSQVRSYALNPQREKTAHSENGKHLAAAIRSELDERGYKELAVDQAQVWISYDVGRYSAARLSGSNSFAGAKGGITITVIDPASGDTAWYGWSDTLLRKNTDPAMAIPEAVDRLFEGRLPSAAP